MGFLNSFNKNYKLVELIVVLIINRPLKNGSPKIFIEV